MRGSRRAVIPGARLASSSYHPLIAAGRCVLGKALDRESQINVRRPTLEIFMSQPLSDHALDQLFREARSLHTFDDRPVSDETLHQLYDLLRLGPTAFNGQPGRYVFVRSAEAKERLAPALSASNRAKTLAAPVTAIVACHMRFYEHLPVLFPAYDARSVFEQSPEHAKQTAERNSMLQAGYLILAARALGLDAGPMAGFDAAHVDRLFFPDGEHHTLLLVNLGYGNRTGLKPRGPRLSFEQAVKLV